MRLIIGTTSSPANPLWRALSLLVGIVVLVAAFFFGALLLAFVIGAIILLAIVGAIRLWWIRRRIEKAGGTFDGTMFTRSATWSTRQQRGSDGRIIEGEFTEVSESSSRQQKED